MQANMNIQTMIQSKFNEITAGLGEIDEMTAEVMTAQAYQAVLRELFKQRRSNMQHILICMWDVYASGYVMYMGTDGQEFNPENFREWVETAFGEYDSLITLRKISNLVTRTLAEVYARQSGGNPFKDANGEPITVEGLLEKEGLVTKLMAADPAFSRTDDDQVKSDLINAVTTKTKRDIEDMVRAPREDITIHIPYRVVERPDDLFDVYLEGLTDEQLDLLRAQLGEALEERLA